MAINYCIPLQGSLCSMLDRSLGGVIPQYASVRNSLLRQARDLLVCAHLGDLDQFERCFLVPAAELIATIIRQQAQVSEIIDSWIFIKLFIFSVFILARPCVIHPRNNHNNLQTYLVGTCVE